MRTLGDVGEFGLIERIARRARGTSSRSLVVGIGDDAAVLRPRAGEDVVVSTDAMVEGVHFRWSTQSGTLVGRRALAVNLSDLAAMGARPLGFTCALAAPPSLPLARIDAVARGLVAGARLWDCPLVGGNVARAGETSLSITVVGAVVRGRALRRSDARAGDRLFVTGTLGGQALALARAERGLAPVRRVPEPRLAPGRALARLRGRGACIDISDGLAADLGHLLERTRLGADIDLERVPRPRGFAKACAALALEPATLLASGGEDYELLFTVRRNGPGPEALTRRLGVRVTEIGRISTRPGLRGVPTRRGWQHYA